MKHINPIYKEEIEKVFRFDVKANVLERKWKKDGVWRVANSSVSNTSSGYVDVRFKGRMALAHRVIYTLVNGNIPEDMTIDHIDEVKTNNNINNLQLLSTRDNKAKSCGGLKPFFHRREQFYRVQESIWFGEKLHNFHFRYFKSKTEAQRLCNAYNSQFGYGKPHYSARTRTPEHWLDCMHEFKDSYFNNLKE